MFHKTLLKKGVFLISRTIALELPSRIEDKNAVHTLKDVEEFSSFIFEKKDYNPEEIDGPFINGLMVITFGQSTTTDEELMDFVADCASRCEFD